MSMKNSNNELGTSFKSASLILFLSMLSIIYIVSCDQQVNFDNPLDSGVTLASPTNLRILYMKETTLVLQWKENIKTYNDEQVKYIRTVIEQSTNGNNYIPIDTLGDTTATAMINEGFKVGQVYYFRVRTIVGSRVSGYSNIAKGKESSSFAPSDFKVDSVTETQREFTWQDNSTTEKGFKIQRMLGANSNFETVANLPANTRYYKDTTTIRTDTTYHYKVFAYFADGTTSSFDTLSVFLPFPPPSELQITSISISSANVSWKGNCSFETGFTIMKHVRGANYDVLSQVPSSNTSIIDYNLDSSLDYFYKVKAFSKYNQSTYSNEIKIACIPAYINKSTSSTINYLMFSPVQHSPDGKFLFFGGNFENGTNGNNFGEFYVFNTIQKTLSKEGSHGTMLTCSAFSGDDNLLATASDDFSIKIWNRDQLTLYKVVPFGQKINSMVFSHDNTKLIVASNDNRVYSWNINNGALIYETKAFSQEITTLSISSDGQTIACASGTQLILLNSSNGNIIHTFPDLPGIIKSLQYSSNGLLAAMYEGDGVNIYNGNNFELLNTITGISDNQFYQLFFTGDNRFIVIYVGYTFNQNSTEYGIWRLSDNQLVSLWLGSGAFSIFPIQNTNLICGYFRSVFYRQVHYQWGLISK